MSEQEFLEIMTFLNGLRDSPFVRPDEYYSMIDLIRSRIIDLYNKDRNKTRFKPFVIGVPIGRNEKGEKLLRRGG